MEPNHQPASTIATAATALADQEAAGEVIRWVRLSSVRLPLAQAISDAKVFTGRQRPMTEVVLLFAELRTSAGLERSEEHTSELQSRGHLVCRLLLEKKT